MGKTNSNTESAGAQSRCLWNGAESVSGFQRKKSYSNPGEMDQKSLHQNDLNRQSRRDIKVDRGCVCMCVREVRGGVGGERERENIIQHSRKRRELGYFRGNI